MDDQQPKPSSPWVTKLLNFWQMLKELRPVRGIIIVGFLISFGVVLNLAFTSVERVNTVISNIEETRAPTDSLFLLNEILNELNKLEASSRAYVFNEKDWQLSELVAKGRISDVSIGLIQERLNKLTGQDPNQVDATLANFYELVNAELHHLQSMIREFSRKEFSPQFRPDTSFSVVADTSDADLELEIVRSPAAMAYRRFQNSNFESQVTLNRLSRAADRLKSRWRVAIEVGMAKNNEEVVEMKNQAITVGVLISSMFLVLVVIIFHDISRSRQLQAKLKQERDRAETLAQVKQRFLANMSHEIRNPLHAVIGFAEQLNQTALNPGQLHLLTPLRRSARYLLALINDILDFSKLDSDNLRLEHVGFSLPEVMEEVASTFQANANRKGIALETELDPKAPEILIGDPLRLRQMLLNLVGNAVKFTEAGKVSLQVKLHHQRGKRVFLHFLVEDTGIGIPQELLDEVFAEWTQADSRTTRRYGGTGLGLAITKRLAELHHGSIHIDSEEGKGTKVALHLALEVGTDDDLEHSPQTELIKSGAFEGKRVLVADDESYNRMLMETMLSQMGIASVAVQNGAEAWQRLQHEPFDLALLDLQMPEMDGFSVTQKYREQFGKDMPIVAVTATATKRESDLSRDAGMNELLLKPFEANDLRQLLARIWPQNASAPATPESLATVAADQSAAGQKRPPADAYSLDHLRRTVGHNPKHLATILKVFLNSARLNGDKLRQAMQTKDLEGAAEFAHKLAPSCRHLGLQGMTAKFKQIELEKDDLYARGEWETSIESVLAQLTAIEAKVHADLETLSE